MKKTSLIVLVGFVAAVAAGCSSTYPPELVGDISGTVEYNGTALSRTPTPVLIVGAFAYQPGFLELIRTGGRPIPHAAFYVQNPVFGATGIPYRLSKVEPFAQGYFVTGVILNEMDAAAAPAVTGLYPDMSLLVSNPQVGPVMVVAEQTVDHVDFQLLDY
jgi:hypothetical protein